jgi:hypothetical protein
VAIEPVSIESLQADAHEQQFAVILDVDELQAMQLVAGRSHLAKELPPGINDRA